jgi:hypothetical protein
MDKTAVDADAATDPEETVDFTPADGLVVTVVSGQTAANVDFPPPAP